MILVYLYTLPLGLLVIQVREVVKITIEELTKSKLLATDNKQALSFSLCKIMVV